MRLLKEIKNLLIKLFSFFVVLFVIFLVMFSLMNEYYVGNTKLIEGSKRAIANQKLTYHSKFDVWLDQLSHLRAIIMQKII